MNATNPLLSVGPRIPFDVIAPEHVVPAVRALIAQAEAAVDAVRRDTSPPTWSTTLGALDVAAAGLEEAWSVVEHLHATVHDDALEAAHAEVLPEVTTFLAGLAMDGALYARIAAFAATDEAGALDGPRARHLARTLQAMRREGAALPDDRKARLHALVGELASLGSRFSTNVLAATRAWHLDVDDAARLAGIPADLVARLAQPGGGWRVGLDIPTVLGVLAHAEDRTLREAVWRGYHARCTDGAHDNRGVLRRMLELRQEQVALLGYATFADYTTADRMAGNGEAVRAFLAHVEARCTDAFAAEKADLATWARDHLALDPVAPWDVGFVVERMRRERFDLDQEALRPYFPLDRVLSGAFALLGRLFDVTVREAPDLPVWHPTVRAYHLHDGDGTHLGSFYLDLLPRPEKRQGGWMNPLVTGGPRPEGFAPHVGLFCANLTPPGDGHPSLLTHREVQTVLHELGHLVHHLFSRVALRSQAGTRVAWDFVELPSQILENWCWVREGLDLVSGHVDTGEPVPDAVLDRLVAARAFQAATGLMRQLGFGRTDLDLHTRWDGVEDPVAYGEATMAPYHAAPHPPGHTILPTFQHLFAAPVGYAAGYYSYMWAAVLDADAFSRFEDHGVLDAATGRAFRDLVLAQGDSDDPAALFRAFMGRDPDPEALLRRWGLA